MLDSRKILALANERDGVKIISVASVSSISRVCVNTEIEFYSFRGEQVKLFSLNTSTDKPP